MLYSCQGDTGDDDDDDVLLRSHLSRLGGEPPRNNYFINNMADSLRTFRWSRLHVHACVWGWRGMCRPRACDVGDSCRRAIVLR